MNHRDSVAKQITVSLEAVKRPTSLEEQNTASLAAVKQSALVAEQDTVSLAALYGSSSAVPHRGAGAIQRMISSGLARLQDPRPEGLLTRGLQAVRPGTSILGLLPILTLTSTLGVLVVSFSYYIAEYGNRGFEFVFLLGLLLIFVPNLVRLLSSTPSLFERICLLCVIGMCFYLVQFMISPLHFSSFDALLHWQTADDILRTKHLFSENSMIPVSPYYPGLEIVTNALSTISGLNTFYASIAVIISSRLLMVLSIFMLYKQMMVSIRMASIATILYMSNPHFLFFDAMFNYETLALPLSTFLFYILAHYETVNKGYRWPLAWIVLLAVTATHHMTDYVFDGLLILWTMVSLFRDSTSHVRWNLAAIAFFAVLLSLAYAFLLQGNPVWGYLSSYFETAFKGLGDIITGTSTARPLFTNQGVPPTPIWDRLLMLASIALVAFGLPFGLFSLWQLHRHDTLAVVLGLASLIYPITQVFRFTSFGLEIPERSAAFLFLPIAYVLTIFITHFWPTRRLNWRVTSLLTSAMSVILLGGILLDSGPAYSGLPGPYTVEADGRSVGPEGIQAALWSLSYLGPDNRVGTDRSNQTLFSTFGDQRIVTHLNDNVDISPVFYSSYLDSKEVAILRQARVRYLVIDLRLSTSLPLVGFYFEDSEAKAFQLTSPINEEALTKFNAIPQINRVFDSGNIVIYDVGGLVDGSR